MKTIDKLNSGDCECDPEHGICIGFRDKKFLGIDAQDWTL